MNLLMSSLIYLLMYSIYIYYSIPYYLILYYHQPITLITMNYINLIASQNLIHIISTQILYYYYLITINVYIYHHTSTYHHMIYYISYFFSLINTLITPLPLLYYLDHISIIHYSPMSSSISSLSLYSNMNHYHYNNTHLHIPLSI